MSRSLPPTQKKTGDIEQTEAFRARTGVSGVGCRPREEGGEGRLAWGTPELIGGIFRQRDSLSDSSALGE